MGLTGFCPSEEVFALKLWCLRLKARKSTWGLGLIPLAPSLPISFSKLFKQLPRLALRFFNLILFYLLTMRFSVFNRNSCIKLILVGCSSQSRLLSSCLIQRKIEFAETKEELCSQEIMSYLIKWCRKLLKICLHVCYYQN